MSGSYLWAITIVLGPILLFAAIFWAVRHNRASKREIERTERATHRLYDEAEREDAAERDR